MGSAADPRNILNSTRGSALALIRKVAVVKNTNGIKRVVVASVMVVVVASL